MTTKDKFLISAIMLVNFAGAACIACWLLDDSAREAIGSAMESVGLGWLAHLLFVTLF